MIVWAYDNLRQLETYTGIALRQCNTTLRSYLEEIRDERNPGDEIVIYILANMYHRHVFIYTKEWWWTTVMFVMPIDEKDVIVKCDLVLVYIRPGIYGEVKEIRAPALPDSVGSKTHNTLSDTVTSVDTTEGHNKSLEFVTKPAVPGPSKTAATRCIHKQKDKTIKPTSALPRRSPRKRKTMNYKDFVSGLDDADHPGLTSPKKEKVNANLKQPSRTRIAAQKKIQQARTQRLCSPPPPTQVTTLSTPDRTTSEVGVPVPTPIREQTTISDVPAKPDQEMNEAANTLLSLSGDADRVVGETSDTIEHSESGKPSNINADTPRPPVAFEVNVIIGPKNNRLEIKPSQIIGSAVKEEASRDEKAKTASTPVEDVSSKTRK